MMGPRAMAQGLLPLALGLSAATAEAKELFRNSGTLSGWDGTHIDKGTKGTVTEVTDVMLKGPTAILSTQTYLGKSYTGRYHAEVYHNDGYKPGDARYYGFSFRLAPDWEFVQQNMNVAQFIADFTADSGGCDDAMPSTMVWVAGNKLMTRAKFGDICNQKTQHFEIGTVQPGKWHTVVLQVSWRADGQGFLRAWLDGAKGVDQTGISTTISDPKNRTFGFRVGLYANGWHDDKERQGSQNVRRVWYDEVAIGTEASDVGLGTSTGPRRVRRFVA